MLKKMQYRLKPTQKYTQVLEDHLEECRALYHHFLAARHAA